MIPLPFITHAIAAAVAALAAWTAQGWRMDAALADLRNSHTQAQAELTDRNAKHLHRVWERGDSLSAQLAIQQAHITRVHQEHAHAIQTLTTGRACLSADLVRVLNNTQPPATDRPDPLPAPTGQPAATDASAFATDADVSTWAATARQQYAACAARLGALIDWHGPAQPPKKSDER